MFERCQTSSKNHWPSINKVKSVLNFINVSRQNSNYERGDNDSVICA